MVLGCIGVRDWVYDMAPGLLVPHISYQIDTAATIPNETYLLTRNQSYQSSHCFLKGGTDGDPTQRLIKFEKISSGRMRGEEIQRGKA